MINQDILKYIEAETTKGVSKENIQSSLLSNGWNSKDVAEGFSTVEILKKNPNYKISTKNKRDAKQSLMLGLGLFLVFGLLFVAAYFCFWIWAISQCKFPNCS